MIVGCGEDIHHAPLPKKDKVPLHALCPNSLRIITFLAKTKQHPDNLVNLVTQVNGDGQIHYALLMHYYKVLINYTPPHNPRYRKINDDEKEQIIMLRRKGYSKYAIAKMLKRHVSTIYYFCKRNKL